MGEILNAYPDEQVKLDTREMQDLNVLFQLKDVLDEHGYLLEAVIEDGEPTINLRKA